MILALVLGITWSVFISHFGASILLHRHYCHKQFDVPRWFEWVGLCMLMVACIKSPIGWIASHRMHHTYSDSPQDPHSSKHIGFWKVLTTTWDIPRIPIRFAKDLYQNSALVFFHHHWLKILIAVWIISFIVHPYFFVGFALVPFVFAKIGFGLLNTLGHKDGKPTNNPWINFFISGEGYHKEHHKNSKQVRLHKYDTAGWLAEKLFVK